MHSLPARLLVDDTHAYIPWITPVLAPGDGKGPLVAVDLGRSKIFPLIMSLWSLWWFFYKEKKTLKCFHFCVSSFYFHFMLQAIHEQTWRLQQTTGLHCITPAYLSLHHLDPHFTLAEVPLEMPGGFLGKLLTFVVNGWSVLPLCNRLKLWYCLRVWVQESISRSCEIHPKMI